MIMNRIPKIEKGNILSREMLAEIVNMPGNMAAIFLGKYSTGVISGINISVKEKELIIGKGIFCYKEKAYFLNEEARISLDGVEGRKVIGLSVEEDDSQPEFYIEKIKIELISPEEKNGDIIELGRFNLKPGAELRYKYATFAEIETEYNVINLVEAERACSDGEKSLNPVILSYFADRLLKKTGADAHDIAFGYRCLEESAVPRRMIKKYIAIKLNSEEKNMTNKEIIDNLNKILKKEGNSKDDSKFRPRERMIVD